MLYLEDADEDKLLDLIKKGSSKSFEVLYQRYHKRIYTYALRLLPSSYHAEEIVQNVFIAVWNQRTSLNFTTTFSSYIFGITRHMVYRQIRQKLTRKPMQLMFFITIPNMPL
ncbi:MAG: sigma-70 family RNA polymerase sigma factor [Bacteroidales bacterium]|nr:sigma-70 family RNA polymerase sigma factor [Bacteroidales bacterium]